jgi:hypothetical protein
MRETHPRRDDCTPGSALVKVFAGHLQQDIYSLRSDEQPCILICTLTQLN